MPPLLCSTRYLPAGVVVPPRSSPRSCSCCPPDLQTRLGGFCPLCGHFHRPTGQRQAGNGPARRREKRCHRLTGRWISGGRAKIHQAQPSRSLTRPSPSLCSLNLFKFSNARDQNFETHHRSVLVQRSVSTAALGRSVAVRERPFLCRSAQRSAEMTMST